MEEIQEVPVEMQMSNAGIEITNRRYQPDPFWGGPKGIKYGLLVGHLPIQQPPLYPDQGSTYFVGNVKLPEHSTLVLEGEFPHERYFSFTVANSLGDDGIGNGPFIRDCDIVPDQGSSNPFKTDNNRNVSGQKYTVNVVWGNKPQDGAPENAIYAGEVKDGQRIHLALRNYIADVGYDGTGVVKLDDESVYGLPRVSLRLKGDTLSGDEMYKLLDPLKTAEDNPYTVQSWLDSVRNSGDQNNAPCWTNKPSFQRFWSTDYSVTGLFITDPKERVKLYPPSKDGGFANNPDTVYLSAGFSLDYGNVVVIKGEMPTSQKTRRGEVSWDGETQVRYWSITTGGMAPSGVGWTSLYDEQIPLDSERNFTIVMSWPEDRPKNAIRTNGVAWIDFGGGEGHYIGARNWINCVYIRYQVPLSTWKESPANIPMPSDREPYPLDAETMGKYYPVATYTSKEAFEEIKF